MEHLFSFTIVVLVQLIVFVAHAFCVNESRNILKYLTIGCLLGLPFGVIFDLVIGQAVGVFAYELGFPLWFLAINGILSYGFMIAHVFLLRKHSLLRMYLWSAGIGLSYEIVNWIFPVWEWTFASPLVEYLVVILAAYAGLTWLIMCSLRIVKDTTFKLIPF